MYRTWTPGSSSSLTFYRTEVAPGRYLNGFKWEGDERGSVRVRPRDLKTLMNIEAGEWMTCGELRLRRVAADEYEGTATYVREDGFWRSALVWNRLRFLGEQFKHRFIYTLMVWGLAYVDFGDVPDWKHIGRRPQ